MGSSLCMRTSQLIVAFLWLAVLLFVQQAVPMAQVQVRYAVSNARQVHLVWGINDWQRPALVPAGTVVNNKTLHTPMHKQGDAFVLNLDLPEGTVLDYAFILTYNEGPLNIPVQYWALNGRNEKKFYHSVIKNGVDIVVQPDKKNIHAKTEVDFTTCMLVVLLVVLLPALLLWGRQRYFKQTSNTPFNKTAFFTALTACLITAQFFVRIYIAKLVLPFLIKPLAVLPALLKVNSFDIGYALMLTAIFLPVFFLVKKWRRAILIIYAVAVVLSVVAALLNSQMVETSGRPFNYQWLYYADFLKSTDAANAVTANLQANFLIGSCCLLLALVPMCYVFYRVAKAKPILLPLFFAACLLLGFFLKSRQATPVLNRVNPVTYFIQSAYSQNSAANLTGKAVASQSDMAQKNNAVTAAAYDSLFSRAGIKNVLVVMLESVAAEYITPYQPLYNATPFLDSIQKEAALFKSIYAHIPATNKSMVSFLCGAYPDVSFKSITSEHPAINLPSLSSELKKYGYRTAFFNSGDNQYQNAAGFLKHRQFDVIKDFTDSSCLKPVFTDKRYAGDNLEGADDGCLKTSLFNWLDSSNSSNPFFALLWTFQTHYPYYVSQKIHHFNSGNPSLEKYLNALKYADENIRQIVQALKQRGLYESTLIVVMADHGEAFGRHNQTTHAAGIYEENLHIPLLFINPLVFNGQQLQQVGGISDVAPSVLAVLGKQPPAAWQGENLFSDNRRKQVYFFSPYSDYLFGLRAGNYKFIFNATENTTALYQLDTDPQETTNIADLQPELVKKYQAAMQAWMQYQSQWMDSVLKNNATP
jgi:lipoteichoic acid synthase